MEQDIIVLGVKKYSFANQDTGEIVEGTNVYWIPKQTENDNNLLGFNPQKTNFQSLEKFETFKTYKFPAQAKAQINFSFVGNKPKITVTDFKYDKQVII